MTSTYNFSDTPFIKVYNEAAVGIETDDRKYLIDLNNIRKMYLKKRKSTYFPAFMGALMFSYEKRYKLHIRTEDEQEIKIHVKAEQRQHYIELIAYFRKLKSKETSLAS